MTICLLLLQALPLQIAFAQMDWLKSSQKFLGTATKSPQDQTSQTSNLTSSEIAGGIKDALRVGTKTVVGQLGQSDGFNADPTIHIPPPESMQRVKSALATIGISFMMDDLELKLNRAAEEATPPAKELFWNPHKKRNVRRRSFPDKFHNLPISTFDYFAQFVLFLTT